MFYALGEVRG